MSKTFLGLALVSLLVSGSAFADQFQFLSPGTVTWNHVYVNPYTAIDTSGGHFAAGTLLRIYCDDWNTDFSGTPTWSADVYALTAGNVSNFKYGNPASDYTLSLISGQLSATLETNPPAWSPLQRYREAAWLDEQWENALAQGTATDDQQRKLAAAVWTLFVDAAHVNDPNGGLIGAINNTAGFAVAVDAYLTAAQTAVLGGYTAPDWDVIVPVGVNSYGGPMQEFLVHTPEPGAVILLGTVLGVLGLTMLRRKRQA